MSRPRKPTPAAYSNLLTSVHQAETGVKLARKRHVGQKRALKIVKLCMTTVLKYERWARQFGVALPKSDQSELFGRAA